MSRLLFWRFRGTAPTTALPVVGYPSGPGIRRMRQTPHLSAEEVFLYYSRFRLDLEVGTGATTTLLAPQVMLQWSKDHGHTWSQEHWVEAGAVGQYLRRVMWRRLGRARDMVFRVVVTDPIPVTLIDAYVDVTKGLS